MVKRKQSESDSKVKHAAKAKKVEVVEEVEEESEASEVEASSEAESSGNEGKEENNDGLADMMSKILNQNTGKKIPVLAKRKTALMKDIEVVHKGNHDLKKLRSERRLERTKQMAVPDASTADFERQLKKLATRGVVALFNAIAKAKRDTVAAEESAKPKKAVTNDDNGSVISRESAGRTAKAGKAAKGAQQSDREQGAGKADKEKEAEKATKWAALRDDYMVGQKLTVKHWDKAAESDSD